MSEKNLVLEDKGRLRWIDQARGFIMLYLVLTVALPDSLTENNPILHFLFDHPGTRDTTMTLFDIGTPAFIFVIGLSLSISFTYLINIYL